MEMRECCEQWERKCKELEAQVRRLQDYKRKAERSELLEAHKYDKLEAQLAELQAYKDDMEEQIDWASRIVFPDEQAQAKAKESE